MKTLEEKKFIPTNEGINVQFVKCNPNASLPVYATEGAAGMDLTNVLEKPLTIKPLERAKVPTGLIIWEDKVATLLWHEVPSAFVIHSKPNAEAYRKFFDDMWKIAK